ncbi:MAG: c(7)-type cytochrome triheme domain-containing protein [Nitrospirota bacterium]
MLLLGMVPATVHGALTFDDAALPGTLPPEQYGDVYMDRSSPGKGMAPVIFSHWSHRGRYTCKVCHTELEFAMQANMTGIICDSVYVRGKYCGACHNGKTAFGPRDAKGKNCELCHNGYRGPDRDKFYELQSRLPSSDYGNKIDWARAMRDRLIRPRSDSLYGGPRQKTVGIDRTIVLGERSGKPTAAVFPHKFHQDIIDCTTCHSDLLKYSGKPRVNLSKESMLKGQSCGLCHLRVAFPLDDCDRCHPASRATGQH